MFSWCTRKKNVPIFLSNVLDPIIKNTPISSDEVAVQESLMEVVDKIIESASVIEDSSFVGEESVVEAPVVDVPVVVEAPVVEAPVVDAPVVEVPVVDAPVVDAPVVEVPVVETPVVDVSVVVETPVVDVPVVAETKLETLSLKEVQD